MAHCAGEPNPADDKTGRLPLKYFSSVCRWFCGPQFLQQPENQWPADHSSGGIQDVTMQSAESSPPLDPIVDCTKFSGWKNLVRVTATVLRAVHIFQSFRKSVDHDDKVIDSGNSATSHAIDQHVWQDSSTNSSLHCSNQPGIAQGCITPQDISNTKLYRCRQSQRDSIHQEMLALANKLPVERRSCLIQLSSFVSADDFIPAGGRLQKSVSDNRQKHFIILDSKQPVVKLFRRHIHATNILSALQPAKALLLNEFWILSIPNELRKMLKRCRDCC